LESWYAIVKTSARLPPSQCQQSVMVLTMYVNELSSCWDGRPFSHNRYGPKSGVCCALSMGRAESPSNTMWHGLRPTYVPSGTLIRPTVWPQYVRTVLETITKRTFHPGSDCIPI